jgi:hypothetical protein
MVEEKAIIQESPINHKLTLTTEEKAIIQKYSIGCRLDWCREEFAAKCIPLHTLASSVVFADIISSAAKDKGKCFLLAEARNDTLSTIVI